MNEKRYKLRFLQLFEDDLNNTILQKSANTHTTASMSETTPFFMW
ncbi:hypothetical protein [Desulfitobacterium hafniense]|nr:hypothetical protein [Desulfitobacterium hafniense]